MTKYTAEFNEDGAHGHGLRLAEQVAGTDGVVLDLGCGSGPLAEPISKLGLTYVGADIESEPITALRERGFEAHDLDLTLPADDLEGAISEVLAERPLSVVMFMDVLEHLADPVVPLHVVSRFAQAHRGLQVVVSIPNVTHIDIASKLLLGRWDITDIGLLDETHVRFFNEALVRHTLARAGWLENASFDVVNPISDQMFPADAPVLRPHAPLREFLRRIRSGVDRHGETYQFVRRFGYDPEQAAEIAEGRGQRDADRDDVFLTLAVRASHGDALMHLLQDVAEQGTEDVEVLVGVAGDDDVALDAPAGLRVRTVQSAGDGGWMNTAAGEARGRYLTFVDPRTRLRRGYLAAVRASAENLPGSVIQLGLQSKASTDQLRSVELDSLDLVTGAGFGDVAMDAHAIPRQAFASGLRAEEDGGYFSPTVVLLHAIELCGIVRSPEPVVVVDASVLHSLVDELGSVMDALGAAPMVIPAGAGSQLIGLRDRLVAALREQDSLRDELAEAHGRIGVLAANLRLQEADLAAARRKAAKADARDGSPGRLRRVVSKSKLRH